MSRTRRTSPFVRASLQALLLVAVLLGRSEAASAWDPFGDETADAGPATPPDPAPYVIPEGVYLVTDVYVAAVVTTAGDTTTYSTTTMPETPGTYARVVDMVGTGGDSTFDGSSFNGRARLADGRAVAGTYYEDFVLTAGGLVSVNVVFFQDDSDTRQRAAGATAASGPEAPSSPDVPALPSGSSERTTGSLEPRAPDETPAPFAASASVALAPLGPSLDSIEVLRGRSVRLWLRATRDGVAIPVRTWRLVTGSTDLLSRREGGGADPCDAIWLTLPAPGSVWTLRFEVTSELAPGRTLMATIGVAVRSPALGE